MPSPPVDNPRLVEWEPDAPIRPSRFGHIVLRTKRFEQMAAWYKTVLQARPLFEIPRGTFLTFDDEHHRVLIIGDPRVVDRPDNAEGVAHFAYLFDSFEGLMKTYARLRDEDGIRPVYCVNHGFQLSLYYNDPDRNEVELGCDTFQTREEMNDWFANGQFRENFFGYTFDPEDVWKMRTEGVAEKEIFARTYQGEAPDLSPFFEKGQRDE